MNINKINKYKIKINENAQVNGDIYLILKNFDVNIFFIDFIFQFNNKIFIQIQ